MKEIGRKLEIGEVIMLGELLIKRTRDNKVEIAVEGGREWKMIQRMYSRNLCRG